jgi:hypothetical protein
VRHFVLPVMAALLLVYVALHSGLRDVVARVLGISAQGCYLCGGVAPDGAVDAVCALALIIGALAGAGAATQRCDVREWERPVVFGLLAFGFLTVPAAIVAGIGSATGESLLRPPAGPLLALIPSLAFVVMSAVRGWRPRLPTVPSLPAGPLPQTVVVLGLLLMVGELIVSLSHPATQGDAMSYHAPLSVFLWHDGNLTSFLDRAPGNFALAHPASTELWIGALRLVGGDRLADLGQLPFALLVSVAVGAFTRRLGGGPGAAWLAGGAVLLAPLVVGQLGTPANDLATGAVLVAVAALAAAPAGEWNCNRAAIVGAGLGLVAGSKLALLPLAAALAIVAAASVVQTSDQRKSRLLVACGVFAVVVSPWWIRDMIRFQNPIYPARIPIYGHGVDVAALGQIDNQFVPSRILWPLYPLGEPQDDRSGFGALLAVAALPGLLAIAWRARRSPRLRRLLRMLGLLAAIGLPAWWVGTLHEPRFLFPLAALALAFTPFALLAVPRRLRGATAALLAAAACFSAIVTVDQVLLPLARQPSTRAAFYDRVWGVDPYVASLPSSVSLLWQTGYGPGYSDYTAYYPLLGPSQRRFVLPVDVEPGDTIGGARATSSTVLRMRRAHVSYAYVQSVPQYRSLVTAQYSRPTFQLVHLSAIAVGGRLGGRRHVYLDVSATHPGAIWRYLFRLRQP